MQTLRLAPHLFAAIDRGSKHVTVRRGDVPIRPGPLTFVGKGGRTREVTVTQVYHEPVGKVSDRLARANGAKNAADLTKKLHRFYPGLSAGDEVMVIVFAVARN